MKCYLRKNYNYDYVHYTGDNFEELKELADPVKVSQTETGAVIHLIEHGHYNLCPELGDFVVKKSCGEEISFELFNEDDFKDKFLQHIMKLEEELFNRLNETSNSFEYIELQAKLNFLKNEIKEPYIKYLQNEEIDK